MADQVYWGSLNNLWGDRGPLEFLLDKGDFGLAIVCREGFFERLRRALTVCPRSSISAMISVSNPRPRSVSYVLLCMRQQMNLFAGLGRRID